ncbi:hypothetical protein WDW86_07280 [Bdellovibrionota bacterium FG-2]
MKKESSVQWAQEFQSFVAGEEVLPPANISENILSQIHRDLNPAAWRVFSKLAFIHLMVGSVTILFCPQFGINLMGGMGLMSLFMRYGAQVCMVACGAVFMGGSALAGAIFLRPEEVRVIRRTRFLQISALTLLSMGVFVCAGAVLIFSLASFWLVGSVLGGLVSLEFGWILRMGVGRTLAMIGARER